MNTAPEGSPVTPFPLSTIEGQGDARARVLAQWGEFTDNVRSERVQQLLLTMAKSPSATLTQREIFAAAQAYGYPKMTNGSRISEMVRSGALVVAGTRACTITGRKVACYALTGALPAAISRECAPKPTAYILLRQTPRGVVLSRISSKPIVVGPQEILVVAPVNRNISSKHSDGTSAVPDFLPDFDLSLGAIDTSHLRRKAKPAAGDGQATLFEEPQQAQA